MLNQEDYVKVLDLHRQGWSNKEIAAELGYHPATIAKRLRSGPPAARLVPDDELVMNARWRSRVGLLLDTYPRLLAVSVFNKIRAEGYTGSYPTVVRAVRAIRGPRFRAAPAVSVPIHTDPGEEVQFDFCDLSDWATRWGGRHRCSASARSCVGRACGCGGSPLAEDRQHTFEGLVRLFEHVGGVPATCRTDRMGALGTSQGSRFRLHPPTIGFAAHHGTKVTACRAGDAKRKGKVERPFRQLQETFLPEIELDGIPSGVDELNVARSRMADRASARSAVAHDRRAAGDAPRGGATVPVRVAAGAVRHRLRRDPTGAHQLPVHRHRQHPLLGAGEAVGPARRDPPSGRRGPVRDPMGRPERRHPSDHHRRS